MATPLIRVPACPCAQLAKDMELEVELIMFKLFPCSRKYDKGDRCKNGWFTRSVKHVQLLTDEHLPKGLPAMDEAPMEDSNSLLRELVRPWSREGCSLDLGLLRTLVYG